MNIGYARVSTLDQNPELQLDALIEAKCDKTYVDHASDEGRQTTMARTAQIYPRR